MFTIKYTDQDEFERLVQGRDIRIKRDGKHASMVSWLDCVAGQGCQINFPTTAYVMNEAGATVSKYVVIGEAKDATPQDVMRVLSKSAQASRDANQAT